MDKLSCWFGVDLGEQSFVAAMAPESLGSNWSAFPHRTFANTKEGVRQFVTWAHRQGAGKSVDGVCVESLGPLFLGWLELLGGRLGPVSPVNPQRTAQFARVMGVRDKTDRVDACVLALFGLRMRPAPRALPRQSERELRALCHFLAAKRAEVRAQENRLLRARLPKQLLEAARQEVARGKEFIAQIEGEIDALIAQDPVLSADCARLETIPGVGRRTAALVLSELGDLRQYKRGEITALAGLYPRQYESGTSVRKRPCLPKTGKSRLRSGLYFPALVARKYCAPLRAFGDCLAQRGLTKKAVVLAVARKLLLLMRALLVGNCDYDPLRADPSGGGDNPTPATATRAA